MQSCVTQLWQISKIRSFLSWPNLEKVSHAFISSRHDHCIALYSGISHHNMHRLQLIQNAAARLLTHSKRSSRITPVLAAVHWLVSCRIEFEILFLLFKALNCQAPVYNSKLWILYTLGHCLRPSNIAFLVVPKTRLVTKSVWAFVVRPSKLPATNPCQQISLRLNLYLVLNLSLNPAFFIIGLFQFTNSYLCFVFNYFHCFRWIWNSF